MESQIKDALIALHAGIKAADGKAISAEMVKLEGFAKSGAETLHPQLLHFLNNRSYAKALLYLEGATSIPAGACGGRAQRPKIV